MSNVGKIHKRKIENRKALAKNTIFVGFSLKVSTFQTFYIKSKTENSDPFFQYSH